MRSDARGARCCQTSSRANQLLCPQQRKRASTSARRRTRISTLVAITTDVQPVASSWAGLDCGRMKHISSGIPKKKDTTALNLYLLFFFFLLCHKHGEPRDSTREDPIVLPTERRLFFLCCLRAGQAELHKQSQAKFRRQSVSVRTICLQLFPLFVYIHLNSCGAVVAHSTVTCMKHEQEATR